jgi:hypothetical protein
MAQSLILKRASTSRPSGEWSDDDFDHRVEAEGLGLPFRPLARLAQMKNVDAPAVKREAQEDWGKGGDRT